MNIAFVLSEFAVQGSEDVGFIVAHPLRKNAHATEVVGALRKEFDESDQGSSIGKTGATRYGS